jgi:hypothetical protein
MLLTAWTASDDIKSSPSGNGLHQPASVSRGQQPEAQKMLNWFAEPFGESFAGHSHRRALLGESIE